MSEDDVSGTGMYGLPRLPAGLIERPALERLLDDDAMITTVTAGAGFGKTTLLAAWASSHPGAGVWIDGSTITGGRLSFWEAVFSVVAQAADRSRSEVLRRAAVPPVGSVGEADLPVVVAAFARSLTGAFVLIVDSAETLDLDALSDDLVSFVRFAPESHLVISDRRRRFRPTLVASDLRETRVTADDLRFSPDETARLIDSFPDRSRGRLSAHDVHRLTGGAIGLMRTVAVAATDQADDAATRELIQRWAAVAAQQLAASMNESAGAGSAPPADAAESAPLMIAALGRAKAEEAADLVELSPEGVTAAFDSGAAHGLGTWTDEGGGFVFAPIVSLAARREIVADRSAQERRTIATRFAHAFARRGDAVDAFGLALDAEDFDLAIAIGKRSFLELVRDDTPGLLRRLKRIPLARLRRYPLIVLFIAILHMQSRRGYAAAMLHFRLAEQLARASEATAAPDDRAVMIGVRSATTRMQGRFDRAVPMAREFLDRFDRLSIEEQDRLSSLSRHFLWQVAHTLLFSGDVDGAIGAAQRMLGVPVPADLEEDRGIHPALTFVAAAQAIAGDVTEARETLAEALTHPPRQSAFHHVWETTAAALSAIEEGDPAAARALVDGLDHDMAGGEYWPIDLVVRMVADLGDGRVADAVDRMGSVLSDSPPRQATATRDTLIVLHALLSLAARPTGTAPSVLRHVSAPGPLRSLAEAMIALRDGDGLKAAGHTRNVLGEGASSPRTRAAAFLVRAAALSLAGQDETAARAAVSGLGLMTGSGLATPWMLLTIAERATILRLVGESNVSDGLREALDRMPVVFGSITSIERLTAREQEVLVRLVAGATIPEVATASGVSPNTIKTQRARIYRKLGVDNRADAARVALEHGLL